MPQTVLHHFTHALSLSAFLISTPLVHFSTTIVASLLSFTYTWCAPTHSIRICYSLCAEVSSLYIHIAHSFKECLDSEDKISTSKPEFPQHPHCFIFFIELSLYNIVYNLLIYFILCRIPQSRL